MDTERRDFLRAASGLAGMLVVTSAPSKASATPAALRSAMREVIGDAPVRRGKVKLDIPPLIDNGNAVPLSVAVESRMTPEDHVRAIHVFNEKNPQPNVVSVYLGPRAGRARIATRMRLADTQTVTAVAQMSDGSFWSDSVSVVVTLAACLEELN